MHRSRLSSVTVAAAVVLSACSITPAATTTTTLIVVANPASAERLTLEADGIGPFSIGDDGETVIDGINAAIGGFDGDSDDDPAIQLPACAADGTRVVSWGSLAIVVLTFGEDSVFASWSYGFDPLTAGSSDLRGLDLRTSEGIGLGSHRDDLIAAYGRDVVFDDQPQIQSALFSVDAAREPHLAGKLDAAGPDGVVDLIQAVPTCP